MKLIVGLGNPGREYEFTRHNIGFLVVRSLAKSAGALLKHDRATFALSCRARIAGEPVVLAEPLTYMNLSGLAVKALLRKYDAGLSDLLIVCDDLNLGWGRMKIRAEGSSGGHKGLASIIEQLNSDALTRLRVGIGALPAYMDAADYVLAEFTRQEIIEAREIIGEAVNCCESWVKEGINECMNRFNKRSKNE